MEGKIEETLPVSLLNFTSPDGKNTFSQLSTGYSLKTIAHFRVALSLSIKARHGALPLIRKELNLRANKISFIYQEKDGHYVMENYSG